MYTTSTRNTTSGLFSFHHCRVLRFAIPQKYGGLGIVGVNVWQWGKGGKRKVAVSKVDLTAENSEKDAEIAKRIL